HPRVVSGLLVDDARREFARDLGYDSNLGAVCDARCEIAAEDNEFWVSIREGRVAGCRDRGRDRDPNIRRPARQGAQSDQRVVADGIDSIICWPQWRGL